MSKKKKIKATPDSIVLGISGEALLVMGLIVAFAGKPQWNGVMNIALSAIGLFLAVWGFALAGKRKAAGDGTLTIVLVIMGAVSLVFGLLGYFNIVGVLISGITVVAVGVVSDIVLAIMAKREKNTATNLDNSINGQD